MTRVSRVRLAEESDHEDGDPWELALVSP
jgi:hypothetical protein